MSGAPVTAADLRPVDLFDDLSDAELEPWAAVAHWRDLRARRVPGRAGRGAAAA